VTFRAKALKEEFVKVGHKVLIRNRHAIKEYFDDFVERFDVIHFLFSGGLTEFKEQFKKYPNKFIITIVSHRSIEGWWDKEDEMLDIIKNSAQVICVSQKLKDAISKKFENQKFKPEEYTPVTYIANGVDVKVFKPQKTFTVGFVGRRHEYKGYDLIKEACEVLGVNFVHDGNEYPKNVTPHDEMPEIYDQFDCLAIASEGEGCHNPTLEALAMNIPVISTDVGIANELDGVTIVDRSVEGIVKGIKKVYSRSQILKDFTWDIIANKYLRIYEGIK